MEFITPEIIKNILAHSGEKDDVKSVLSSDSEAALGHGENYCSNIVRLFLKLQLTSGKIFNKPLVLKVFLENLDEIAKDEMIKFFANEAVMYDKILINMEKMANSHNLNNLRIWPECYFADTNVVVFEDLKEQNYVLAPRHDGLTLSDAIQVIRGIGRFHAMSVIAVRRNLIDPLLIRRTYPWAQPDSFVSQYVIKGISTTGEIVQQWGNEWTEIGKKISDYSKRMPKVISELYLEDVKLKVVNHGDAWINNLMVKYNENHQIDSLRFVDFQNATYNSYAWDLIYFLYTSLQAKPLRTNYDTLLTSYREEFVETVKSLGEDPSLVPTMDEINAEIVRLHPFCLTIACTVQSCVFNTSDQPMKIDELVTNDTKIKAVYSSANWNSSIKVHLKYFLEQNVI